MSPAAVAKCHAVFFRRTGEHGLIPTPTLSKKRGKKKRLSARKAHWLANECEGRQGVLCMCLVVCLLCLLSISEGADIHVVCTGADIPLPDWTGVRVCR